MERQNYRALQQHVAVSTVRRYNQSLPIVQNLDFGHTDPQIIQPVCQMAYVDSDTQQLQFDY